MGGCWSYGGWSSQDKNGNKACGPRGTGLELPYPWGEETCRRGRSYSVCWPWAPRAKALSPRPLYRSCPVRPAAPWARPQGWWGGISPQEAIYKCTAVPLSRAGPSPSTNRVQAGWLRPWAGGRVFPGRRPGPPRSDQSVSTTSSPSLFSSPSESSSSLYRYSSPSATECLSSVASPSSLRLQVLTMTGMLGSRLRGT